MVNEFFYCQGQLKVKVPFCVDSGASHHIVNKTMLPYLLDVHGVHEELETANETITATVSGSLQVSTRYGGTITLQNVLVLDDIAINLLSVQQLYQNYNYKTILTDCAMIYDQNNNEEIVEYGYYSYMHNKYVLDLYIDVNDDFEIVTDEEEFEFDNEEPCCTKTPTTQICIVPGCNNSNIDHNPPLGFFCFPTEPALLKEWTTNLGVSSLLEDILGDKDGKYQICSTHFDNQCFENADKLELNIGAIPFVHVPSKDFEK